MSADLTTSPMTRTIYSDSDLCVKTVNEWAAGWERRGW